MSALVNGSGSPAAAAMANGAAAAEVDGAAGGEKSRFAEGMIYPPPEIRNIVDKTAAYVAKNQNPGQFEEKMRLRAQADTRFSFILETDAYHAYYRQKIQSIKAGEAPPPAAAGAAAPGVATGGAGTPLGAGGAASGPAAALAKTEAERPKEPPAMEFLADMPTINAVDLDIIRLTALFTARSGRRFTSDLAARESRNYQFDFLRPSHSLFPYFNRLVEQYTKVLIPNPETLARLERMAGGKPKLGETEAERKARELKGRREVLKEVRERVEWERFEGQQRKQQEDDADKERTAFNEIDWQDFVIVSTVEFTDQDQIIELPPPMSISEVENMTIAQKRMAAMIMEGKDVDEAQLDDAADAAEADALLDETRKAADQAKRDAAAVAAAADETGGGSEDEADVAARKATTEIKKAPTTAPAGMKIRKDYVPKSKQGRKAVTTLCQICGQHVAVEEIGEHVRIELLDPRWKDKKRATEANRSAASMLTVGSDVSSSLRELARARSDIFDQNVTEEEKKRRVEEQERLKRLAKEKYTWDGHMATGERITNAYQSGANLDEQIEALHRAKGLTGEAPLQTGPQIGPSASGVPTAPRTEAEQPPPADAPPPSFAGGATLSAGPQPAAAPRMPPTMDPARAAMMGLPVGPPPSMLPPPFSGPPPSSLPGRPNVPDFGAGMPGMAPPSAPLAPPGFASPFNAGVTRPAEDDLDSDQPNAKRPRVARLPDGQLYTEQQWIDLHPDPISLTIKLPVYTDKPEWGCDGGEVRLDELPMTLLNGVLRDRLQHLKGIPTNRQQLRYNGKILANQATLASTNLDDGDVVTLQIREQKKK